MPKSRPAQLLVDFSTVWLVGLCLRSVLFAITTGSPLPETPLTGLEQSGLVCLRFLSMIPGTLTFALAFTGIRASAALSSPWRFIARCVCWGAAGAFALSSYASWASLYITGEFLGAEAWTLASSNFVLLIEHVVEIAPWLLVLVPALAISVVLLMERACRASERWPLRATQWIVGGVGCVLLLSIPVAYAADRATERDGRPIPIGAGGEMQTAHDVFLRMAEERSGPTARLLVDSFHSLSTATMRVARAVGAGTRGARVITAAEYARHVVASRAPKENVLVVFVESLRKDELIAEGGPRIVMPSLEALAREGTVYTHVIAPAAQSDYATTSVLSSQFPLRAVTYRPFPATPPYPRVLPYDILHLFGYRTGVFSSQNEYWGGMYNFLQTGGVDHFLHAETFHGPTFVANADRGLHEWIEKTGHAGKIDDRDTIDEAIAWTDSIPSDAPFFAYINLQSSHNPYLLAHPAPPRFGAGHVSFPILFDVYPRDSAQAVRDLYDNTLAYADAQLGRLFSALKKSGRWDSTIVAVVGDHGEAFYEHGFGAHGGELYGEVTRVPMVIRAPHRTPSTDSLPASSLDLMPTLLGLLQLPPHPSYQGVDLAQHSARRNRPLFTLTQTAMADEVSVEQSEWKLQFDARHTITRLYDLRHDPGETHDVAERYPAQRDALMATIASWWAQQIAYYETASPASEYYAPALPVTVPLSPPPNR